MSDRALISEENWPYSRLKSDKFQAFISFGALPQREDKVSFIYSVTVTDADFAEIFQKNFSELYPAIDFLNKTYGHWDYHLASEKASGDGCSSCAAH